MADRFTSFTQNVLKSHNDHSKFNSFPTLFEIMLLEGNATMFMKEVIPLISLLPRRFDTLIFSS